MLAPRERGRWRLGAVSSNFARERKGSTGREDTAHLRHARQNVAGTACSAFCAARSASHGLPRVSGLLRAPAPVRTAGPNGRARVQRIEQLACRTREVRQRDRFGSRVLCTRRRFARSRHRSRRTQWPQAPWPTRSVIEPRGLHRARRRRPAPLVPRLAITSSSRNRRTRRTPVPRPRRAARRAAPPKQRGARPARLPAHSRACGDSRSCGAR